MIVTLRTPIGDIVAKQPRAAAVFEQHQIDYCCEGDQPLQAACHRATADPALVLDQILRAAAEVLEERDWTSASLADLCEHIVSVHHAFIRRGLAALASRLGAPGGGGARRGDGLQALVEALLDGLEPHLRVEEQRVFPAIVRAEQARLETRLRSRHPNASLTAEIAHLGREHRLIDTSLRQLCRTAARELEADRGGAAVLQELAAFQADVHRHLHLENNILFPRATALEDSYA